MKHQKSINSDHVRRRNVPSPENEQVSQRLTELLSPSVWAQQAYYRQLGLRERILTLPLIYIRNNSDRISLVLTPEKRLRFKGFRYFEVLKFWKRCD